MRGMVLFVVLILVGFCSADLGDEWDSFSDGNDSASSPVGVDVNAGASNGVGVVAGDSGEWVYTQDFYIALGVGVMGILVVAVFLYFFFRKPRNKWERKIVK